MASGKVAWSSQETLQAFESASWTVGDQVRAGGCYFSDVELGINFQKQLLGIGPSLGRVPNQSVIGFLGVAFPLAILYQTSTFRSRIFLQFCTNNLYRRKLMHIICSYLTVQAYKYSRDVLTIDFVHTVQTKQTWMFGLGSLHAKEVHSFHIYAVIFNAPMQTWRWSWLKATGKSELLVEHPSVAWVLLVCRGPWRLRQKEISLMCTTDPWYGGPTTIVLSVLCFAVVFVVTHTDTHRVWYRRVWYDIAWNYLIQWCEMIWYGLIRYDTKLIW